MKYRPSIEQLEEAEQNRWLTDQERAIFNLYFRRGWRIEDIAAELDRSRSTVIRKLKCIRDKCGLNVVCTTCAGNMCDNKEGDRA